MKNLFLITLKEKVPKKLWALKKEDISYLGVFKCLIYVEILKKKKKKVRAKDLKIDYI